MPDLEPKTVDFPQPTVGRIVHFFATDYQGPRAAMVLGDIDPSGRYGTCTLKVYNLDGEDTIANNVLFSDKRAEDSAMWWDWPPRV